MNLNNSQNQGYWFVVREDQSNVIFSSNNFTIQNPQNPGDEARYIIDTGDRQFIQIHEPPASDHLQEPVTEQLSTDVKEKDVNFWDRSKIKMLLTLCLENNFKNYTKDIDLLDNIASHLGTTPDECINKYKNLRRTFIRLLKKKRQGKEIKWVHFSLCEKVYEECKLPSTILEPWDDFKVRNLLNLYIENLNRFRNSDCLQKDIWRDIALQIGTSQYNCYHKFKNLKRTYFNWLQRSRQSGKPVKWPYNHYFERIFYNHSPHTGPWNRTKTRLLMNAYLDMVEKFKSTKFQKKDLWKEIASIVDESPHNCDKKFRNLKQTYLKLKLRADAGKSITKWKYYNDFETIYRPTQQWDSSDSRPSGESYIKQLLQFYVDNKDKFKDSRIKKKHVWRMFGSKIGLSSEECDRKFRNLKQTYLRLSEKNNYEKTNKWPYFSYFEKIFDEPKVYSTRRNYKQGTESYTITDFQEVLIQLQNNKEDEKFKKLISAMEDSNNIQKERNKILQALLDSKC